MPEFIAILALLAILFFAWILAWAIGSARRRSVRPIAWFDDEDGHDD